MTTGNLDARPTALAAGAAHHARPKPARGAARRLDPHRRRRLPSSSSRSVFPVYWMVNTSLQPNAQVRGSELHFWPDNFTLENYTSVIAGDTRAPFLPALGQLAGRDTAHRGGRRSSSRSSRRSP